jgi:hypothetical protein
MKMTAQRHRIYSLGVWDVIRIDGHTAVLQVTPPFLVWCRCGEYGDRLPLGAIHHRHRKMRVVEFGIGPSEIIPPPLAAQDDSFKRCN